MLTLIGLVALPVAALTAITTRDRRALLLGTPAALIALLWLALPGALPDQVIRSAALIAVAAFAITTLFTGWSVTHRSLSSVVTATMGVTGAFVVFGWSWDRLHWWVAHQAATTLRLVLSGLWNAARLQGDGQVSGSSATMLGRFESGYADAVRTIANLFPASAALQMLIGMGVGAAIYYRVARHPVGRMPGRFSAFRFSEHVGWAAVIPLAILLLPKLDAVKLLAWNLLTVTGALYALRGAAVVAFAGQLWGSPVLYVLGAVALFFMLPFVPAGALLLGVLDSGLDLRRRWSAPRARE